jgi:hypothetical protein
MKLEPAASTLDVDIRSLIGDETHNFRDGNGKRIYERVGSQQLRRVGATDHCIICGIPGLPGVVAFAHIHMRDLHLSPKSDPTRVFCLCWLHHHGCYDQGYISTIELLEAEAVWVANKERPQPHARDSQLMQKVAAGIVTRHCVWTESKIQRIPTFDPGLEVEECRLPGL